MTTFVGKLSHSRVLLAAMAISIGIDVAMGHRPKAPAPKPQKSPDLSECPVRKSTPP